MDGVLAGVRVLDFGRYIAGPFCGALLADLGADVIRVERVHGGEDRFLYPVTEDGDGALFLQMNRNKRGLTLDPKAPDAGEILRRLIAGADVVVANLPAATLRELGLDYESLTAVRPDIILTAVSAFGSTGPYADRVGFDGIGQAMSGAAELSGFESPTKSFASWVDMMTATLAAFGTMAAIHERARTGRGQVVEGSLLGSALTVMNFPLIEHALTGVERERTGNRGQSGGPTDIVRTRDGWIIVQVIGEPLFRRWAKLVGEPGWIGDPRFASDAARAEVSELLSERTQAWCQDLSTDEALARLAEARIPAGPVYSPGQARHDRHVQEAGMLTPMNYPGASAEVPLLLDPVRFSATPAVLRRPSPRLGEHTGEVLAELGFTAEEIEGFRRSRTI